MALHQRVGPQDLNGLLKASRRPTHGSEAIPSNCGSVSRIGWGRRISTVRQAPGRPTVLGGETLAASIPSRFDAHSKGTASPLRSLARGGDLLEVNHEFFEFLAVDRGTARFWRWPRPGLGMAVEAGGG